MSRVHLMSVALAAVVALAAAVPATARASQPTIVETALAVNSQSGEFSTLIAALQAAGLVDALNGKGQYTVFAPTDAAFAALGLNASNIGSLPTATLTSILLYHVAPGERFSGDVVSASRIRTLSKGFLMTMVSASGAYLIDNSPATANAQIIAVDIDASNGVIHVINNVLLP